MNDMRRLSDEKLVEQQLKRLRKGTAGASKRKAGGDPKTEIEAGTAFAKQRGGRYLYDLRTRAWREFHEDGDWRPVEGDIREDLLNTAGGELRRSHSVAAALTRASWRMERRHWDAEDGIAWPGGWHERETGQNHTVPSRDLHATCLAAAPADHVDARWADYVTHFLGRAAGGTLAKRKHLARWLQAWAYSAFTAQGQIFERFLFLQGRPGGGKSTFTESLRIAFGGHARVLSGERAAGYQQAHREWMAQLDGKRLAVVEELPDKGAAWKSAELNALVSGEGIQANFMRRNSFEVRFRGGLIVTGNTKPRAAPDSGIFRRMALLEVPAVPAEERDPEFKASMLDLARDGVVTRWILEGRRAFLENVLRTLPPCMEAAVTDYRDEQDVFQQWIADCCEVGRDCEERASVLLQSYVDYTGSKLSPRTFGQRLKEARFRPFKSTGGRRHWSGLRVA
ncbi:MAG: hypothetical protein F4Y31_05375 [Gammaproteobacteria bacterium]|nr:hypothetical protein [Gammaproteobacteria bacterium]MYF66231.1 hypothetical protein [Gammaproteobacteria bacterium]MYK38238.1 hypothetical protein [Gammaproteobacteria bacterium]